MVAASSKPIQRAEDEVFNLVRDHDRPVTADVVTKQALAKGIDEFDIFSAIWFLVDEGRLELDLNLKLTVPTQR